MSEYYQEADVEESHVGLKEASFGVSFWTPKGENGEWTTSRVRICPPRIDHKDKKYYFWVALHGNLPGVGHPVACPQRMFEEPCAACDASRQFYNANDKESGGALASNFKALVNVIPLMADGSLPEDPRIKVWSMPKQVLEALEDEIAQLDRSERNISSPITGRDVFVRRKGTQAKGTNKTEYKVKLAPASTPMAPEMLARLNEMTLLTDVYKKRSSAEIRTLMLGESVEMGNLLPVGKEEADPWDEVESTVGEFKEIKEEKKVVVEDNDPPWGDDDDDDDVKTEPKEDEKARINAERAKLLAKLQGVS